MIKIKSIIKKLESLNKDDEYISDDEIRNIIGKDNIDELIVTERGKTYPYNNSNPYSHDSYKVFLINKKRITFTRQYGRPNWAGKVNWVDRIIDVSVS